LFSILNSILFDFERETERSSWTLFFSFYGYIVLDSRQSEEFLSRKFPTVPFSFYLKNNILLLPDLNYCGTHEPCLNGGTCENPAPDEFLCKCPDGFSGTNCQVVDNVCATGPCLHGGNCSVLNLESGGAFNCSCPPGWTGSTCQISKKNINIISFCWKSRGRKKKGSRKHVIRGAGIIYPKGIRAQKGIHYDMYHVGVRAIYYSRRDVYLIVVVLRDLWHSLAGFRHKSTRRNFSSLLFRCGWMWLFAVPQWRHLYRLGEWLPMYLSWRMDRRLLSAR